MSAQAVQLDLSQRSMESRDFEAGLRRKIVGQDEAVQAVVDLYQVFRAELNSHGVRWGICYSWGRRVRGRRVCRGRSMGDEV